jgi:hypothetical protein
MRMEKKTGTSDSNLAMTPDYYFPVYHEAFKHLAKEEVKVLELGVYKGESLKQWRDYFKKGIIVGVDRNPAFIMDPTKRIRFYKGSQEDFAFLDQIAQKEAPDGFDIIIDDCSHIGELTRTSFWHLFENHLKPGGIYAIEDIGTSYLPKWVDGKAFKPGYPSLISQIRRKIGSAYRFFMNKTFGRFIPYSIRKSYMFKRKFPNHPYGMVAFIKELVDATCLNDKEGHWGNGIQRFSKIQKMQITRNMAILEKTK